MNKICSKCKINKSFSEFFKGSGKYNLQSHCKMCHRKIVKIWILNNLEKYKENQRIKQREYRKLYPERVRKTMAKIYKRDREKILKLQKEIYTKRRLMVINRYGNKCVCCGENNIYFLTLDHINNDGYVHRKTYKGNMFNWAIKNNYPKTLQILCFNCNSARQWYGGINKICPHKFIKDTIPARMDIK